MSEESKENNSIEEPTAFPNRSVEDLTQLAKDIATDRVFTDRHIPLDQYENMVGSIFMLIPLGAFSNVVKEGPEAPAMVYEYYDKAGPLSVNGYPCFLSMGVLNEHDAEFVLKKAKKIKETIDNF